MAVINRYGYGEAYGDGPYKGSTNDSLTTTRGLAWASTRKCFHLGFNDTQGWGWDEVQDGDWVWPENQACVLTVVNNSGQQDLLVFDEKSGLPYVMNTREGPSGSDMVSVWKDKVDDHVSGSGTEITTECKLPEHYGAKLGFDIWHEQSRLHVRPVQNANRSASGFGANGLPTGIEFASTYYADGDTVADGAMTNIATNSEYVHDRKFKGNSLQQKISSNVSNFRAIKTESVYKVSELQKMPSIGNNTESSYEAEFALPIIWLTRGETQLRNRYDNSILTGTVSATTGPDGLSNSAMSVTSVTLGNAEVTNGTIVLFSTTEYAISGVTLVTLGDSPRTINGGSWYLRYVTGLLPAALSLGAGTVFDFRIYNTVLSTAALTHYGNDIESFAGREYLPITG